MSIDLNELELAVDFSSSGHEFDSYAYLDKQSGKIYLDSDASEDELPADLHTNEKYIVVPSKQELGLDRQLALDFTSQFLPNDLDTVYGYFSSRGAYAKFKNLLDSKNSIEQWYEYEKNALMKEITQWCSENEINI